MHFTESISSFGSILGFVEESSLINLEKNLSCWNFRFRGLELRRKIIISLRDQHSLFFASSLYKNDERKIKALSSFFTHCVALNRTENVPQLFFFLCSSLSHLTLTVFANQQKCLISSIDIIFPNVVKCCKMYQVSQQVLDRNLAKNRENTRESLFTF